MINFIKNNLTNHEQKNQIFKNQEKNQFCTVIHAHTLFYLWFIVVCLRVIVLLSVVVSIDIMLYNLYIYIYIYTPEDAKRTVLRKLGSTKMIRKILLSLSQYMCVYNITLNHNSSLSKLNCCSTNSLQ